MLTSQASARGRNVTMKLDRDGAEHPVEPWRPDVAVHVWTQFANAGGNDKDRMVVIATWLLTLSAGIILYFVKDGWTDANTPGMTSALFAILGVVVSAAAAYLVMLYGGYANLNWGKADAIAELYGWRDLLPHDEGSPTASIIAKRADLAEPGWLTRKARARARPCTPEESLAPVFIWFFRFAVASLVLHLALLVIIVIPFLPSR